MFKTLWTTDLYIKIGQNRFEAKNLSTNSRWESAYSEQPFTTDRLLVGTFTAAEPVLTQLVKSLLPKGFMKTSPRVVMHPVTMVDGGLSEVEERIFRELALGSGAFKAVLHVGSELSDSEAIKLINCA